MAFTAEPNRTKIPLNGLRNGINPVNKIFENQKKSKIKCHSEPERLWEGNLKC